MYRSLQITPAHVGAAVLALFCCAAGQAADDSSGWDFRLTPLYYWSVNISGDTNVDASEPPNDLDSFDFEFEGAFSTNFKAVYNQRWGLDADVVALSLSDTNEHTELKFKYKQWELAGFYRMPAGQGSVDWLAGGRYFDGSVELEPTGLKGEADWVDPFVGARWNWPFADTWSLSLRGDIGGFGVGSDFSWQTIALVDWAPWKHVSIRGGIRALSLDYSTGSGQDLVDFNITMAGPVIGVSFRW